MPRLKSVEFGSRHKAHLVAVRHLRHGNDPSSSELSVDSGVPRTRRVSSIRNPRRQARAKPGAFSIPVHEFPEMSNILRFQASMSARRQYRRRAIRIGCGKFRSGRCSHRHRGISLMSPSSARTIRAGISAVWDADDRAWGLPGGRSLPFSRRMRSDRPGPPWFWYFRSTGYRGPHNNPPAATAASVRPGSSGGRTGSARAPGHR